MSSITKPLSAIVVEENQEVLDTPITRYCVVIPTFNHSATISTVVEQSLAVSPNIIVVNDGSSDDTLLRINAFRDITVISYSQNKGKGHALKAAFRKALEMGFDYAITIDSDGQHDPNEIPLFIDALSSQRDGSEVPQVIIVGSRNLRAENMPGSNSFANTFSNFWFKLQTGVDLPDTQSGFRLYPLKTIGEIHTFSGRYEYELELLVRCTWRGVKISTIPISVRYEKEAKKISHFKPFVDFTRISILNALLTIIAIFAIYPRRFFRYLFCGRG